MALTTLGIDLGIASIGWVLITEDASGFKLNGWGSRIFTPGMADDIESGKGVSRCAERRQKRALRIQYRRRRQRKNDLIDLLQCNELLPTPLTPNFFVDMDKRFLMLFPVEQRRVMGHLVPYLYRKKALDTKLDRFELGRTIYHLAQRRGYLSNRKQDLKDEEASGVVKAGIDALKNEMRIAGARTLGEYFCTVDPEKIRIRTRYTDRSMFQQEFRLICNAQRHLISPELEDELYEAIFFQRKLRSTKYLIGHCQIYPEERRCSYAKDEAQRFRIYSTVSHLRITQKQQIRSLTEAERTAAISVLNGFSGHLDRRGKITLAKLAKAVGLGKGEKFTLSD